MPSKPTDNTDLFPGVPERTANLIVRYYDANLSDEESAELRAGLTNNAAARDLFVHWGLQIQTLTENLAPQYSESDDTIPLEQLAEMEENAEADTVTLVGQVDAPATKVSAHDYAEAGRYLFEHALANKRLLYTAGSAVAAVLLIALSLVFIFSGGPDEPVGDPLADVTLWDTPTPKHLPVVATLTDEVGAQWRSDDKPVPMPMGAQLVAFERYTLTHGFAEITTRRGATALLQAPCTIELTDHDNAIRLHSGKLVGKCETPASKGFIVHAPDIDVVDLGTEFGVEADAAEGSTVLVMTGEVRAQPTDQSPLAFTPVVLRKDQARQIVPETGGLGMIAVSEAPVFYEDAPHPYVAAVLDTQPVAYWRFEDDANKTIVNEVDPQRDALAIVGPAKLTDEGVFGRAGRLENQEKPFGYFETTQSIRALDQKETFTVELWYYTDQAYTIDSSVAVLYSLFDRSDFSESSIAILENDDRLGDKIVPIGWRPNSMRIFPAFIKDGPKPRELYTQADYPVRRWQHFVLVNEKDTVRVYLDGELAEEVSYGLNATNQKAIRLGLSIKDLKKTKDFSYDFGQMRPLRGRLDEVALYDKPLTAAQIARHYDLATGRDTP